MLRTLLLVAALVTLASTALADHAHDGPVPGNHGHGGNGGEGGGGNGEGGAFALAGGGHVFSSDNFDGNVGKDFRKAYERHAEAPGNVSAHSFECDTSGVSGTTGVFGLSIGGPTETCRAARLLALQDVSPESWPTKLATFKHYATFPFRLVLGVVGY